MSTTPSGNQAMRTNSNSPVEEPKVESQVEVTPETPIPPQSQLQSIPSLVTSRGGSKEEELKGLGLNEEGGKEVVSEDRKEASEPAPERAEGGEGEEAANVSRVMGTHRFSVLNKDLLELHGNDSKKKDQGVSKACKTSLSTGMYGR